MFEKLLKPWPLRIFLKKNSWLIIIITFVLLLILAGFSIYGDSVGDLLISADNQTIRALSLSETGEFEAGDSSTFLAAEGIKDIRDSTYYYIPEDIAEGNGLKSDMVTNRYFAYTFYLKNVSNVSVGYYATLKINQYSKGIDKAVRIMMIIDDEVTIYARPKDDGSAEELVADDNDIKKPYTTVPFAEDEIEIRRQTITDIGSIQKYTLVMWLEGWDPDCRDNIIGGKFSASVTFRLLEAS